MNDATEKLAAMGFEKLASLDPDAAARAHENARNLLSRLPAAPDPFLEPVDTAATASDDNP